MLDTVNTIKQPNLSKKKSSKVFGEGELFECYFSLDKALEFEKTTKKGNTFEPDVTNAR